MTAAWVAAIAAAGCAAAAGLALLWHRRWRAGRLVDPDEVADAADAALPGFVTMGAAVGADGLAALVVAADRRVAVVRRRGRRLLVREIGWQDVRTVVGGMLVEPRDRAIGTVVVRGVTALDVRRLGPVGLG